MFIGPYNSTLARIDPVFGAKEVGYLSKKKMNADTMQKLLEKGKPGDCIQLRLEDGRVTWPHTVILVKVLKNGIRVFDCNSDGKNTVKVYVMKWKWIDKKCTAISLYHAEDYK